MIARSSSARKPIDSTRSRPGRPTGDRRSSGTILPSRASTPPSMPRSRGTEKPQMSASRTPTVRPRRASATARLTVTDDLPTPPLPDATASTRAVGGTAVAGASSRAFQRARAMTSAFSAGSISPMDIDRGRPRAARPAGRATSRSIWPRSGQPAMVRATSTSTVPSGSTVEVARPCRGRRCRRPARGRSPPAARHEPRPRRGAVGTRSCWRSLRLERAFGSDRAASTGRDARPAGSSAGGREHRRLPDTGTMRWHAADSPGPTRRQP